MVTPWGGDASAAPLQELGAMVSCVSRHRGRPCNTARPGEMTLCEMSIQPGHARKELSTLCSPCGARPTPRDSTWTLMALVIRSTGWIGMDDLCFRLYLPPFLKHITTVITGGKSTAGIGKKSVTLREHLPSLMSWVALLQQLEL